MNAPEYKYLEDMTAGQKFTSGPLAVTTEEIIAFARQFDPQEFHTDPEKAKTSFFGAHVASGWHTSALTMRLILMASPPMKGGMIGRRVSYMDWPRPVYAGDQLSLTLEVLNIKISDKNPERGIMNTRVTTVNQKGETVLEMETVIYVPRRAQV